MKYGYIYKTTNLINGKSYIGQHKSKIFESTKYIGSGKFLNQAFKKYGKENFKCELLEWCENKDELNEKEKYWIKQYNAVENSNFYNIAPGGETSCFNYLPEDELVEIRKKMRIKPKKFKHSYYFLKYGSKSKGKKKTSLHSLNISKSLKKSWGNKNKEELEKININRSKAWQSKTPEERHQIALKRSKNLIGKKLSQETKEKISKSNKGKPKPKSGDARRGVPKPEVGKKLRGKHYHTEEGKHRQAIYASNRFKGTIYVNNGVKNYRIKPELLSKYIRNGYIKGKITNRITK